MSGLDGGEFGEVASYLPGRKVEGIMVGGGRVTVQIRSQWAVPAPALAALVTAVLAPLTGCRPVDVVVADIDDPSQVPLPARLPAAAAQAAPGLPPA